MCPGLVDPDAPDGIEGWVRGPMPERGTRRELEAGSGQQGWLLLNGPCWVKLGRGGVGRGAVCR